MRILIVCSYTTGKISPFVLEQTESLREFDIMFDFHKIRKGGFFGYFMSYFSLIGKILLRKYDAIHAHYGLSGLIASLQPLVPTVVTFHGSDVNEARLRWLSRIAYTLSDHAIFVNEQMSKLVGARKKFSIIPCGVDIVTFNIHEKKEARKYFGFNNSQNLVLFASSFDNEIKNPALAKFACERANDSSLIELKNYSRKEVNLLLNACDLLLLTSFQEGSPQIVKEAMACNCPVLSTNVGDVSNLLKHVTNSFVCSSAEEITDRINQLIKLKPRTNGRIMIVRNELDLESVALNINKLYLEVI